MALIYYHVIPKHEPQHVIDKLGECICEPVIESHMLAKDGSFEIRVVNHRPEAIQVETMVWVPPGTLTDEDANGNIHLSDEEEDEL